MAKLPAKNFCICFVSPHPGLTKICTKNAFPNFSKANVKLCADVKKFFSKRVRFQRFWRLGQFTHCHALFVSLLIVIRFRWEPTKRKYKIANYCQSPRENSLSHSSELCAKLRAARFKIKAKVHKFEVHFKFYYTLVS